MMTEPRRALAALALVPVAAGVFAGSVAWAADRSLASKSPDPSAVAAPLTDAPLTDAPLTDATLSAVGVDPQAAAIAGELDVLRARLAAVQAELDARAAQAAAGPASDPAPQAAEPAPRPKPAPKAAPPVDTTTRASG